MVKIIPNYLAHWQIMLIFASMFEKEIERYERIRAGHPLLIIELKDRSEYISALKQIRTEGSDEYLVAFFFKTAIERMESELAQKRKNSLPIMFF